MIKAIPNFWNSLFLWIFDDLIPIIQLNYIFVKKNTAHANCLRRQKSLS